MHSTQFLDGVRIVTVAQNVPGPLAAARMRQAGAQVTKIEPPAGDPFLALSPAWHAEMHEGMAIERLDLKDAEGQARLTALLADADVFIASQRPSALARLSLDPDTLRSRAPRSRVLRIVGSVKDPEHPGHDLTYQAESGLVGDATPRTLAADVMASERVRSEEHTSELQSHSDLVCRLLLEKKKTKKVIPMVLMTYINEMHNDS